MRTIKISAKAKLDVKPDFVNFIITLTNTNEDYDIAIKENNNNLENLSKGLIKLGFKLEDIITTNFYVDQKFESVQENNQYKQILVGYKINHKIKLSFNLNHELINLVIDTIEKTNSNALFNIEFTILDKVKEKTRLLENAYKNAYNDAKTLAEISNNKLGEVTEILYNFENLNFNSPVTLKSRVSATNDFNFEPEKITLEEEVKVTFELK